MLTFTLKNGEKKNLTIWGKDHQKIPEKDPGKQKKTKLWSKEIARKISSTASCPENKNKKELIHLSLSLLFFLAL